MAMKEQIEAAEKVGGARILSRSTLVQMIDAALAVPVDPASYSQQQVEGALAAFGETSWSFLDEDIRERNSRKMRCALAAAGVPALSDTMQKIMHQRENEQSDRIEAQHKRIAELEAQLSACQHANRLVAQSSGSAGEVTDAEIEQFFTALDLGGMRGWESWRRALTAFLAARRERSEAEPQAVAVALSEAQREALERAHGHFASLDDSEHMVAIGELLEPEPKVAAPVLTRAELEAAYSEDFIGRLFCAAQKMDHGLSMRRELASASVPAAPADGREAKQPDPSDADVCKWSQSDIEDADEAYDARARELPWSVEAATTCCISAALDAVEPKLREAYEAGYKAGFRADEDACTEVALPGRVLLEPLSAEEQVDLAANWQQTPTAVLRIIRKRFHASVVSQPEKRETVEDVLAEMRCDYRVGVGHAGPHYADRIEAARARESEVGRGK